MRRRTAIAALLGTPVVLLSRPSQAAELGPKQLAAMLLRILAYDRNIKARSSGKSIPILVIYQGGNPSSESVQSDVANALEDLAGSVTVTGLRMQISALAYSGSDDLNAKILAIYPVAMFVCTGLAPAIPGLVLAARKRSILTLTMTMTMTTHYLKAGLSIGLERGDRRVNILVNLPAARAEGADSDSDLLRGAEVYR